MSFYRKITRVFLLMYLPFTNVFANAETVQEQLPRKGKYEYIKRDAIPGNKKIFELYEAEKSKKIIFICTPNFFSFTVNALWDLEITTKAEAEKIARDHCAGNLAGYSLLGYKISKEIRL